MKPNNNNNKVATLFIQGIELIGLSGIITPETRVEFPDISVTDAAGKFFVECGQDVRVLHQDDVLALKQDGEMYTIAGPSRYGLAVAKVIAGTRLGMNVLITSDESARAGQDEYIKLISTDGRVTTEKHVGDKVGAAIILFENKNGRKKVLDVIVRRDYLNDEKVAKALKNQLSDFARQESGAFWKAQDAALDKWLLEAKAMFVRDEIDATTKVVKAITRKRVVPIGHSTYTILKGGKIERTNNLGTFPADVVTLVNDGVSTQIRKLLAVKAPQRNGAPRTTA